MRFCFCGWGGGVGGGSVDILWHCVEEGLRDIQAFDSQSFEIDFASGDTARENAPLSALEHMHYEAGGEDDGQQNGEDDDQEDPE